MMEIMKIESTVHILSSSKWCFIFVQSVLDMAHSFEDCSIMAVTFDLPVRSDIEGHQIIL